MGLSDPRLKVWLIKIEGCIEVNSWVENARKWGGGTHVCGDFWPEVKVEGQ